MSQIALSRGKIVEPKGQARSHLAKRSNVLAAWLALIGLIIPAGEVQFYIGGAKFTAGRLGVLVLLIPAIIVIFQRGRRLVPADLFAGAAVVWMIAAGYAAGDAASLSSSVAEALEIGGGYFIARAFFFGPTALFAFLKVLRAMTYLCVLLAFADTISHRLIVHESIAALLHVPATLGAGERAGFIRAASTFDHPILLGVFCGLVTTLELYAHNNIASRLFSVPLCFFGCLLSFSSAGLIAVLVGFAVYSYDRFLRTVAWRWWLFWGVFATLAALFCLLSNHPLGWLISHLTLEPETGYFRLMIWDAAVPTTLESPFVGFGFHLLDQPILNFSVDSVWLVLALRFGIPMAILLFLANFAAILSPVGSRKKALFDGFAELRTGFTLILILFIFLGFTVHYWNYLWIFWGICIGVRASLGEYASIAGVSPARVRRGDPTANARALSPRSGGPTQVPQANR